jgi:low affinity Fe/Cu permease
MRIVDLANSRSSLVTIEADRKKERAAIIEKYAVHMKMIEETQVGMNASSAASQSQPRYKPSPNKKTEDHMHVHEDNF